MGAWFSRPIRATVIVLALGLSVVRAADPTVTVRILPAPSLAQPQSQAAPAGRWQETPSHSSTNAPASTATSGYPSTATTSGYPAAENPAYADANSAYRASPTERSVAPQGAPPALTQPGARPESAPRELNSSAYAAPMPQAVPMPQTVPMPSQAYASRPASGVVPAVGEFAEGARPTQVVHPEALPEASRGPRLAPGPLGITSGGFDLSGGEYGVVPASAAIVPATDPSGGVVYGAATDVPVVPPPGARVAPAGVPTAPAVVPPPGSNAPRGYQPVSAAAAPASPSASQPVAPYDGRERIYSTPIEPSQVVPASAAGRGASGAVPAAQYLSEPVGPTSGSILASRMQPPADAPPEGALMDHEPGDLQGMQNSVMKQGCASCGGDDNEADNYTIAVERVPMALLFLETGYTLGKRDVMRIRMDGAYGWQNPDRLEFFQAKAQADGGKGPPARERSVDYQDLRLSMIRSGPKFQIGTDMGLRSIDGDINHESIGLADMTVNTKTVMFDEDNYKFAQLNIITIPTGYVTRGMGTGHVSMEVGGALSYKINDRNYAHAQIGYWIPIAADPILQGQMWHHGLAWSTVLWDHPVEDRAILGMLEFDGWTILTGSQTNFTSGTTTRFNPETIFNVNPGMRFILNEKAELAAGFGFRITSIHWYEEMFRLELRWMY